MSSSARIGTLGIAAVLVLGILLPINSSQAAIKAGSVCKKAQQVRVVKGVELKCVKSGKKLVWRKSTVELLPSTELSPAPTPSSTPIPTPTATPTPSLESTNKNTKFPTDFSNLFENRQGAPLAAWTSVKKAIEEGVARDPLIEVNTGPNTKPYFEDYAFVAGLVAKAFPSHVLPKKTIVIRFNYSDQAWAEQVFRAKLTVEDRNFVNRFDNGGIISTSCDVGTKDCRAARFSHTNSGLAVIILGVWNALNNNDPAAELTFKTGMVEAHEYFHGLQMAYMAGKNLREENWPPAWFREGSAQWTENAVINHKDFDSYRKFIKVKCDRDCQSISEAEIVEFLTVARQETLPSKFSRWLNYNMGAIVVEALVSVKGHESLVEMYKEFGSGSEFAPAFKKVYGIEWQEAIPILAKTVYANIKDL